jgi:hypothetical protein
MHQLFHTVCPDNRGFNRAPGFGVLAASCPTERDIPPQIKELAPYPFALIRSGVALPPRWVWSKAANGTSILLRCVYVGTDQTGRLGAHFTHALFDIPADKGLREVLAACAFPFWKQAHQGPPTLATVYNLPPGILPTDAELTALIEVPSVRQLFEMALAACLQLGQSNSWKQLLLPAENDTVLHFMHHLSRVLPAKLTADITFSTLEHREGIAARIVGLPLEQLKQTSTTSLTANLLDVESLEGQLSQYARDFAHWCLEQISRGDFQLIQQIIGLAEQCQVGSMLEFLSIWKFQIAPHSLSRAEVAELMHREPLKQLVFQNAPFLAQAVRVVLQPPLDSDLLRQFHTHEKQVRKSRKTAVEEGLIEAAVAAFETGDVPRIDAVLNELRSYHRVTTGPTDTGILSLGFSERSHEIFQRINQRIQDHPERPAPSVDARLKILELGRQWLTKDVTPETLNRWLPIADARECLQFLNFFEHDRYSEGAAEILAQILANYFQSSEHDLTTESALLEWFWQCPAKIVAQAFSRIRDTEAQRLSAIWRNPRFSSDEFLAATVVRSTFADFRSVYDVIRVELFPSTIRQFIREGNRTSLGRVSGLRHDDVLRIAAGELQRELFESEADLDDQTADQILSVARSFHARFLNEIVRALDGHWSELPPASAAWIIKHALEERGADEVKIQGWFSQLNDQAVSRLLNNPISLIRTNATYEALQRDLPVHLTGADTLLLRHLIEQIVETLATKSATGREIDVTAMVERSIRGLIQAAPAELLAEPDILEILVQVTARFQECSPLLQSCLDRVPEETLQAHFEMPAVKTRWEAALRILERNYDQNVQLIRTFAAKMIYVELCSPWFRISNPMSLRQHLNYPDQADTLSRRIIAARFLVSEVDTELPTFPELLVSLKREEASFQHAFFQVLRQSGDAIYNRLLRPFQDPRRVLRISILDERFEDLFLLWQQDVDYMSMMRHFVTTAPQVFNDPRMVAAALFPLIRHVPETTNAHRKLAEQLIENWMHQAPRTLPEECLWQLRECIADLDAASKSRFLELCSQAIALGKSDFDPIQPKPSGRSWFRIRRSDPQ